MLRRRTALDVRPFILLPRSWVHFAPPHASQCLVSQIDLSAPCEVLVACKAKAQSNDILANRGLTYSHSTPHHRVNSTGATRRWKCCCRAGRVHIQSRSMAKRLFPSPWKTSTTLLCRCPLLAFVDCGPPHTLSSPIDVSHLKLPHIHTCNRRVYKKRACKRVWECTRVGYTLSFSHDESRCVSQVPTCVLSLSLPSNCSRSLSRSC